MPRAITSDAGDPRAVRRAQRLERRRTEAFNLALLEVLQSPAGRAVLWELLARAGVYRSVWDNSARIHYNAGRQDFGQELIGTIVDADEKLYLLMEAEGRARAKREDREVEAWHAAPLEEENVAPE
jgi:hypothetical protein